jgi:hypothetical protein
MKSLTLRLINRNEKQIFLFFVGLDYGTEKFEKSEKEKTPERDTYPSGVLH